MPHVVKWTPAEAEARIRDFSGTAIMFVRNLIRMHAAVSDRPLDLAEVERLLEWMDGVASPYTRRAWVKVHAPALRANMRRNLRMYRDYYDADLDDVTLAERSREIRRASKQIDV